MAKSIDRTIAGLAEQAIKVFNEYGFKTEKPVATATQWRNRGGYTGSVEIEFAEQRATGQASFSQATVRISASIYLGAAFKAAPAMQPWDVWKLDTMQFLTADERPLVEQQGHRVVLAVHYTHHDSGSNGKTRHYVFKNGKLTVERNTP